MKKLLVLALFFCSSISFAQNIDYEINCRPLKQNELFKNFSFRLRDTASGKKMVQNSAMAAPVSAKSSFKIFEINPQILLSTDRKIEVMAGDSSREISLAIERDFPTPAWYGRVRIWKEEETSSFRSKVLCLVGLQHSNGQPVINN